jgi:glycosyltransferase involved in cell wall biosynthesis
MKRPIPKIGVGIICYNEYWFIDACIQGALLFADKIAISDGTMNGTNIEEGQRSDICEPSTDGTLEKIDAWAAHDDRIAIFNCHGSPTPTERELRNIHLAICSDCDWFLIVDADEIWDEETAILLKDFLTNTLAHTITIRNYLFFKDPCHWFETKHMRAFKNCKKLSFVGNNEVNLEGDKYTADIHELWFHHYGYIDPDKVRFKMDLYGSQTFYRGCGPWWYKNIFQMYNGKNEEELTRNNHGTMHPWGKLHPGFAADEFKIVQGSMMHPHSMRQYFDCRKFTYELDHGRLFTKISDT